VIDEWTARTSRRSMLRPWMQAVLLFLVAFVPRVLTAVHGFVHQDERRWLVRSEHYARALLSGDFANATSSTEGSHTMPGITTTVVGGIGRVLWGGLRDLGVVSYDGQYYDHARSALIISQVLMAAATSALLVLLWWVLTKWSTRIVATTAVVILATEPILVADGTKLKTDSFLMLFGAIGAFALAAALDVPQRTDRSLTRRTRWLLVVVAGIGVGGALASKLTALTFGPFFVGLVVYAAIRAWRSRASLRDVVTFTGLAIVVAAALIAVIWPAIWANPSNQLEAMRGTSRLQSSGHLQFFFGKLTEDPGPFFYFVVVPFRMTPWLFLVSVPSLVVSLRVRVLRGFAVVALAYAVVPFATIALSPTKFDRYTFPLWPVFAVLVGLLVQAIANWSAARGPRGRRRFAIVAAGAITGVVVYTMLVVPYGYIYGNPLLGGSQVADRVMQLGVDSATEAGDYIRDREGDRCASRIIRSRFPTQLWFPCGRLTRGALQVRPGDYVVVFANRAKVLTEEQIAALHRESRVVKTIRARGVDVADVLQVR
jgi:hypothetical protein